MLWRFHGFQTMVQMLRVLLQQQMMKGAVGEDQFKDVLTTIQSNMAGIISTTNREKEEQEEVSTAGLMYYTHP